METRIARLEVIAESTDKRLGLIETDLRGIASKLDTHFYITWGGIIASSIGLATLVAKSAGWF